MTRLPPAHHYQYLLLPMTLALTATNNVLVKYYHQKEKRMIFSGFGTKCCDLIIASDNADKAVFTFLRHKSTHHNDSAQVNACGLFYEYHSSPFKVFVYFICFIQPHEGLDYRCCLSCFFRDVIQDLWLVEVLVVFRKNSITSLVIPAQ